MYQSIPQYVPQNFPQYQYFPQYFVQNVHQNVAAQPNVSNPNEVYAPKNNEKDEREYKNAAIKIGIEKATTPCNWTLEFANPYTPAIKKSLYNSFIKSCATIESVISCIPQFNGSTIIDYTHQCPFWIIQHQKLHGIEIYYYAIKVVKNEMEKLFTFGLFKNISLIVIDEELIFTKDLKPKPSKDLLTMLFWSLNSYNDVKCIFTKKESKPIVVVEQSKEESKEEFKEQPSVVIKTKLLAKLERYKDAMSKLDTTDKDDLAELVDYQTKIEKVNTELNELTLDVPKNVHVSLKKEEKPLNALYRDVKECNVVYKPDPGAPVWSAIAKK
jgi:hypothetical protein